MVILLQNDSSGAVNFEGKIRVGIFYALCSGNAIRQTCGIRSVLIGLYAPLTGPLSGTGELPPLALIPVKLIFYV